MHHPPSSSRQASRQRPMHSLSTDAVRRSWRESTSRRCRSSSASARRRKRQPARQRSFCSRPRQRCSARLSLQRLKRNARRQRQRKPKRPRRLRKRTESPMPIWQPTTPRKRPRVRTSIMSPELQASRVPFQAIPTFWTSRSSSTSSRPRPYSSTIRSAPRSTKMSRTTRTARSSWRRSSSSGSRQVWWTSSTDRPSRSTSSRWPRASRFQLS